MTTVTSLLAFNMVNRALSDIDRQQRTSLHIMGGRTTHVIRSDMHFPFQVGVWQSNTLVIYVLETLKVQSAEVNLSNLKVYINVNHPALGTQQAVVSIPKPPPLLVQVHAKVDKNNVILEETQSETEDVYGVDDSLDAPLLPSQNKTTSVYEWIVAPWRMKSVA